MTYVPSRREPGPEDREEIKDRINRVREAKAKAPFLILTRRQVAEALDEPYADDWHGDSWHSKTKTPSPLQRRILDEIAAMGYRPGDVIAQRAMAARLGLTPGAYASAVKRLRYKGAWPYRAPGREGGGE